MFINTLTSISPAAWKHLHDPVENRRGGPLSEPMQQLPAPAPPAELEQSLKTDLNQKRKGTIYQKQTLTGSPKHDFLSLSIFFFHPRCGFVVFVFVYLTQAILPLLPFQPFPNWRNCTLSGGQCKKSLLRRSLLVSGLKETPAACSPCCPWWDGFCGAPGCSWM